MKNLGDYLIEERDSLKKKLEAIELLLGDYEEDEEEEEEEPVSKNPNRNVKKPSKDSPVKKCGYCHKTDHRGKDCPDKPTGKKKSARTITCKNCGEPGHFTKTCKNPPKEGGSELSKVKQGDDGPLAGSDEEEARPETPAITREQVQELKNEGMSSLQVAARLKCRLGVVNEFW